MAGKVVGGDGLLANKPVLQRAVKMRSPYVDALSLLQLRAQGAFDEQERKWFAPAGGNGSP
mgnify:CR=1 FL=1